MSFRWIALARWSAFGGMGFLVPLALAGWAFNRANAVEQEAIQPVAPLFASVGLVEDDGRQPATMELVWVEPSRLTVYTDLGVITSLDLATGEVLANGRALLSADGQQYYAHVGGSPFFRTLKSGSKGEDVAELHRFLLARELLAASPSDPLTFSAATAEAVRLLTVQSGRPASRVFDPSLAIFVSDGFSAASVSVELGQRVSAGTDLAVGTPEVSSATVVPGGGAGRTGLVRDTALEVGITDELVLESDHLVLDLVGREIVAMQFAADRPETVTLGYVRRLTELRYGQVPASSVVADGDRTCILTGATTETLEPLAVSPVPGKPGVVLLEEATVGLTYLANPYEVLPTGGSCS